MPPQKEKGKETKKLKNLKERVDYLEKEMDVVIDILKNITEANKNIINFL